MNIITHANAYSLYPDTTFHKSITMKISTYGPGQELGLEKYTRRGWRVIHGLSGNGLHGPSPDYGAEMMSGTRWVGDDRTWTISLPPINSSESQSAPDVLPLNAWTLCFENNEALIRTDVLDDPSLRYRVTFNRESFKILDNIWPCIPRIDEQ
jgi:hypothetical protein